MNSDIEWLLILSPNEKLLILMLADQWLVTWTTKEAGVSPGWTRAMMKTTFTLTRNPGLHNYSFLKTRSNFKRAEHSEHSFCKNLLYLWGKNHFHPLHRYPVSPFLKQSKYKRMFSTIKRNWFNLHERGICCCICWKSKSFFLERFAQRPLS